MDGLWILPYGYGTRNPLCTIRLYFNRWNFKNMDANLEEAGTILKHQDLKFLEGLPTYYKTRYRVYFPSRVFEFYEYYTVPVYLNKNNKFSTIHHVRQALQDSDNRGIGYVIGIIWILITMIILSLIVY